MEKLTEVTLKKISLRGNKAIVTETVFDNIVEAINKQSEVINLLMEKIEEINNKIKETDTNVANLQNSIRTLAQILRAINTED